MLCMSEHHNHLTLHLDLRDIFDVLLYDYLAKTQAAQSSRLVVQFSFGRCASQTVLVTWPTRGMPSSSLIARTAERCRPREWRRDARRCAGAWRALRAAQSRAHFAAARAVRCQKGLTSHAAATGMSAPPHVALLQTAWMVSMVIPAPGRSDRNHRHRHHRHCRPR